MPEKEEQAEEGPGLLLGHGLLLLGHGLLTVPARQTEGLRLGEMETFAQAEGRGQETPSQQETFGQAKGRGQETAPQQGN